jgi:hypothetical protein
MGFIEDFERRRQQAAEQCRKEFREDGGLIPDLDFDPPDCSICGLMTEYVDGYFVCGGCDVSWPQNGYGHEATRADGSDIGREVG